ncbi:MAG TPA: hypothetical protein VG944_00170 [Fimbriimonas sp.]|nr:hypothetical protein [Fimbriimonas sp.]
MAAKGKAGAPYYAAAVLAAITLFVFFTLQDYGPGSAIRRFHDDVISQNYADLQRICREDINSLEVGMLAQMLNDLDERGATSTIASEDRSAAEVDVLVLYRLQGGERPYIWVVKKNRGTWQIDPFETVRANQDTVGRIL